MTIFYLFLYLYINK